MDAKKFRDMCFWAITCVNTFLGLVSFWTSKLGLDTVSKSQLVSVLVAFGGNAFTIVLYFFLSRRFPQAPAKTKGKYLIMMALASILIFGFSTLWSIITLGGKEAVGIHMQRVLAEADKQGLLLLKKSSAEANLAPNLSSLAIQFESYASREAGGAFSGMNGEGEVVATLRNTSSTFQGLAYSVQETERESGKLYDKLKEDVSAARDVLTEENEETTLRSINLRFSKKLSEINEGLTKMAKISSLEFVKTVSRNLEALTIVVNSQTSYAQKETIVRLQGIIRGAQEILNQLTNEKALEEVEVSGFTMISMGNAIIKYASEIFYAWCYGIALDFAPLIFIFLLAIAVKDEEKEITIEEAKQVRKDAEIASHEILDGARQKITGIITELRPTIESAAKNAADGLEESAEGVVRKIRNQVEEIKEDFNRQMSTWRDEFQKFKFKI